MYFSTKDGESETYILSVYLNDILKRAFSQHEEAINKIKEIVQPVINSSIYDKVYFINDWITNNTTYDESKTRYKVYDLLFSGESVCNGYAQLFKSMCDACEVQCQFIKGYANGQPHAFNQVVIDGVIKYIDITWNAQSKSLKWYLLDSDLFMLDHTIYTVYN